MHKTLLTWILCLLFPALASAQASGPDDAYGGLLLKYAGGLEQALVLNTDVDAHVSGLVARVSLRQEFRNTSPDYREGVYVFPLPDGAAVDQMRLQIGERVIEGEIREKEAARREYQQALAAGRKASLVEQDRPNLFTTSVANIAPGETVVVEIAWLEEVAFDSGRFAWRFPLTVTPRYQPDAPRVRKASLVNPTLQSQSAGHRVSMDVFVNAGMTLDMIESRYHAVAINGTSNRYHVSLAGNDAPMDHDFELVWRPRPSQLPRATSFSELVDGELHHLVMVVPPNDSAPAQARQPRETLFIIDTSGSMHGNSLQQAQQALLAGLGTLQPGDLFNIIEFNSSMQPVFRESVYVDTDSIRAARSAIGRLRANGGTDMAPALAFALRQPEQPMHLRQVIFMTDGAVDNEEALYRLIRNELGQGRLFTVGIGAAPNSWFMRMAAELGRGSSTLIAAPQELGEKISELFRKIDSPQLTDIELDGTGDAEMYPQVVPDLYAGEPVMLRFRGLDATSVRMTGNTAGGPWQLDVPVSTDASGFGVAALWARARLAAIDDRMRRGGNGDELRAEAVETALRYHLVSRYTSLVAVDRTPELTAAATVKRSRVASLAPQGMTTGFPATATPAALYRLAGIALLLLAAVYWYRSRPRVLAA